MRFEQFLKFHKHYSSVSVLEEREFHAVGPETANECSVNLSLVRQMS